MIRFFGETHIDFMGKRRFWATLSVILVLASIGLLVVQGLKLGVEFQGGAEVVLQFRDPQRLAELRRSLAEAGFERAQVTTVSVSLLDQAEGEGALPAEGEGTGVQIKVPLPEELRGTEGAESGDLAESMIRALRSARGGEADQGRPDLNIVNGRALTALLAESAEVSDEEARRAADAILAYRRLHAGLVPGLDQLLADPSVSNQVPERVARALRQAVRVDPRADLNTIDRGDLARFVEERGALTAEEAEAAANAILDFRDDHRGVIEGLAELEADPRLAEVLSPEVSRLLETEVVFGDFALRSNDFIGSQVSGEMRRDAILAICLSLVGMFLYIGFRFKGLQWGLAAILALAHDVIIVLGAFSLAGMEATLPVVAAFLTLVGYSVNDTIVVFDRIRENLRARRSLPLVQLVNESLNQTLSRTVITSGTTWVVVASLFFFGGSVIHGFAFVLLVGVLVGTYSSVFVASPAMLFWQSVLVARRKSRQAARRAGAAS
jgi:preprotein translocase subunit SecF